jgi:hypothetical protein
VLAAKEVPLLDERGAGVITARLRRGDLRRMVAYVSHIMRSAGIL